jgi:polyisoprenoid-binding protein YceI
MKQRFTFLTIAILLLGITRVLSAQGVWKVDKAHSQVKFVVTHMIISEVTGAFTEFDATLTQPTKDDFSGSSLSATIQTTSINTDNDKRDDQLRSDNFFNAPKFPENKFVSTSFKKTGDDTYTIEGNLTIRDVTRHVVLTAKMTGTVTAWGHQRAGFKATASIDRFDYGVKWNKTLETGGLIVSRKVDITLLMEMVKQQDETQKKLD